MTYGADRRTADLAKPAAAGRPSQAGPRPAAGDEGAGRIVLAIAAAVLILLAAAFPIYVILFTLSEGRAPVLGTPPATLPVAAPEVAAPPVVLAPAPQETVPEEEAVTPPAVDPGAMAGELLDRLDDLLAPLTR